MCTNPFISKNMKRGVFICLLSILSFLPAISRQMSKFISGLTYSITTKFPVDSVKVVLWKGGQAIDSTFVEMLKVNGKVRPYFNFEVTEAGSYMVKCFHPRYESYSCSVSVKNNKNVLYTIPNIYLQPKKTRYLREARVRAGSRCIIRVRRWCLRPMLFNWQKEACWRL